MNRGVSNCSSLDGPSIGETNQLCYGPNGIGVRRTAAPNAGASPRHRDSVCTPQDRIEKINEAWGDIHSLTVMIDSIADMDHDDAAPSRRLGRSQTG